MFFATNAADVRHYVKEAFPCVIMQDAVYTQIMESLENNCTPKFNDVSCTCQAKIKTGENGKEQEIYKNCKECKMTADEIKGKLIGVQKRTKISDLHVK